MKLRVVKDKRWKGSYYLPPDDDLYPYSVSINPNYSVTEKQLLFIILHELGHAYYKHGWRTEETSKKQILKEEKEAWEYGKRCIKEKYYKEYDEFVSKRLEEYEQAY